MRFSQKKKTAAAGNNYVFMYLPEGLKLKQVNARNGTTPWRRLSIEMVNAGRDEEAVSGLGLSNNRIQTDDADIQWQGELTIERPLVVVRCLFHDCAADDLLTLTVGYE